ncbi:hypothetical protein RB195_023096 [Necator americanus]|uniref:Uncharacterized protein n=1 Tax=Necator americanus TaxID=51031 RepID=A0ABR1EKE8_NECAM
MAVLFISWQELSTILESEKKLLKKPNLPLLINKLNSLSLRMHCARKRVRCIATVKESEKKGMHKGILPSRGILTVSFAVRDWVLDFNLE